MGLSDGEEVGKHRVREAGSQAAAIMSTSPGATCLSLPRGQIGVRATLSRTPMIPFGWGEGNEI